MKGTGKDISIKKAQRNAGLLSLHHPFEFFKVDQAHSINALPNEPSRNPKKGNIPIETDKGVILTFKFFFLHKITILSRPGLSLALEKERSLSRWSGAK
jgi:hypothetical protein